MSVGKLVKLAADPDGDSTSVPITRPRFVLAFAAVVAPVPPEATASVADSPAAVPVVFWLNVGHVNVPVLKLPDAGVPSAGVTSDGLVDKTTDPVPVELVTPVPPLATARIPATVTAPCVAELGVSPVVPKLMEFCAAPLVANTWTAPKLSL